MIRSMVKKFFKVIKKEALVPVFIMGKVSKKTLGFHQSLASEGRNNSYSWFRLP